MRKQPEDDKGITWDEVPETLLKYSREPYAEENALGKLYAAFQIDWLDNLPADQREEFCDVLYHRYSACVQLRVSRAIKPEKLQ